MPGLLLLALIAPAEAAEVTELAPALRGDLSVDYLGHFEHGHLREDGEDYGLRRHQVHALRYHLEFAPVEGVGIWLQADQVALERLAFEDGWAMGRDPATNEPTYAGSEPLGNMVVRTGSGLSGAWIGAAFAPWAERRVHRGPQVTWRLDGGVRMPNPKSTFWTSKNGKRGVAPGGFGFLVKGAFSVDNEPVDIYLVATAVLETKAKVDVIDQDGTERISGAQVRPPHRVDLRTGGELQAWSDGQGSSFAFDLFLGVGYVGWSEVPSGVLLPDVLDDTLDSVVPSSSDLRAHAGVGAFARILGYATIRAAVIVDRGLPVRPEDPYPVIIGADTFGLGVEAGLEGHFR